MRKLLIALTILTFSSCADFETEKEMYDRWMSELECPIVLIGRTDKAAERPSIVVRDAQGRVRTFGGYDSDKALAAAIADSRSIGDTLKPCSSKNQQQ